MDKEFAEEGVKWLSLIVFLLLLLKKAEKAL